MAVSSAPSRALVSAPARENGWGSITRPPATVSRRPALAQDEPIVVVEHQRAAHRDSREGAVAPRVQ
jgi:hypothetical protein